MKLLTSGGALAERPRFLDEALALARLGHPHVAKVLDSGREQETDYLVLELLAGGSLEDRLAGGPLEVEEARRLAREVAEGLAAAHEAGVLHRDLKPANVLLDEAGLAQLADFGLAVFTGRRARTKTGWIVGTPEAMAPEVLRGEPASEATDVYALGCLVFQLAHGVPARTGTIPEVLEQATAGGLPGREHPRPLLDAWAEACLAPQAAARPGAEEVARGLASGAEPPQASMARTQVLAAPPSLPSAPAPTTSLAASRAPGPSARRWPLAVAVLGSLVAVAGLLSSRPPAAPATTEPPSCYPAARAWLRRWDAAPLGDQITAALEEVHRQLAGNDLPAGRDYHAGLHEYRTNPTWRHRVAVDEILAGLRLPDEQATRAALDDLLAARAGPAPLDFPRARLAEHLRLLAVADAYPAAWGKPGPYGALGRVPDARYGLPEAWPGPQPPTGGQELRVSPSARPVVLQAFTIWGEDPGGYKDLTRDVTFDALLGDTMNRLEEVESLLWEVPAGAGSLVLDLGDLTPPVFLALEATHGPHAATLHQHFLPAAQQTRRVHGGKLPASWRLRLPVEPPTEAPSGPPEAPLRLRLTAATPPGIARVDSPLVYRAWWIPGTSDTP